MKEWMDESLKLCEKLSQGLPKAFYLSLFNLLSLFGLLNRWAYLIFVHISNTAWTRITIIFWGASTHGVHVVDLQEFHRWSGEVKFSLGSRAWAGKLTWIQFWLRRGKNFQVGRKRSKFWVSGWVWHIKGIGSGEDTHLIVTNTENQEN